MSFPLTPPIRVTSARYCAKCFLFPVTYIRSAASMRRARALSSSPTTARSRKNSPTPRFRHTKTYQLIVYGQPSAETLAEWRVGVWLFEENRSGGRPRRVKSAPCTVQLQGKPGKQTTLRVVLREGRKRQLRRIAAHLGHPVRHLRRTHIGQLSLASLRPGEYRVLGVPDIAAMRRPDPSLTK